MPNVPIPVVGTTYRSRSKPAANQLTQNLIVEPGPEGPTMRPFPGAKLFSSIGGNRARGVGSYKNQLYAVVDNSLFRVDENGVASNLGSIAGSRRCHLEEATSSLVVTTGESTPYKYDGSLVQGTDSRLVNSATSTYINNRVVYDGDNGEFVFANLSDPLTVSGAVSEDTKVDLAKAVKAFRDQLFTLSSKSIVPYYNTGTGSPPYQKIQNSVSEVGLCATASIANNFRYMYFLGSDLVPYRISGLQPDPIGDSSIGQAIESYFSPEDSYATAFNIDNLYFYYLSFAEESWLYTEGIGWTTLSNGVSGSPHLMYDYEYCYGKHLIQSRISGDIYELDFDTFTDAGEVMQRRRQTRKVSGKDLGFPGKEIFMDRLELVIETGVGLITGQGSDPRIMMSFSDDGGRTWSPEQWGCMGKLGDFDYSQNPYWTDLGSFYERQFRFTVTDPVDVSIISANADISVGV